MSEVPLHGLGFREFRAQGLGFRILGLPLALFFPPPATGSNRPFQLLDLYWRLPESDDVWFTSRQ